MPANLVELQTTRTQLLHQAAVDTEFREELEANPGAYGIDFDEEFVFPDAVEEQDETFLKRLGDDLDGGAVAQCETSCSFGPFTIICDGTTKW